MRCSPLSAAALHSPSPDEQKSSSHVPGSAPTGPTGTYTHRVNTYKCTHCGTEGLMEGFIEDAGEHSRGYARWIEGALERGVFGGAKRMGRPRRQIEAYRCPTCGHLELFASNQV